MENKKWLVMVLILVLSLAVLGCGTSGGGGGGAAAPTEPLVFDNFELTPMQARGGETGTQDGALWFSNAKTTLESGTYEILLSRARGMDARGYGYLQFELMTDNLDLTDDMGGFFPRIRTGETYTQFQGTPALRTALAELAGTGEWVTVTAPIGSENIHENGDNYRSVLPRVDSLMFRFILQDMEPINGKIYIRNVRFTN